MSQEAADRDARLQKLLSSKSSKKLIIAGPGTGKTYTFQQALRAVKGKGLAITFINNLVEDLRQAVGTIADVHTFHGLCKHLLHKNGADGLDNDFDLYLHFPDILAADLSILNGRSHTKKSVEKDLHTLDNSSEVLDQIFSLQNYYNAVSHTDLVCRVLHRLRSRSSLVPVYPLVVVDEYQDFSFLETEFIALLAAKNAVLIVGDDDQALYNFKHASPEHIRVLVKDAAFEKFELPYCSRCTKPIIDAVAAVIAKATTKGLLKDRIAKPYLFFPPEKQQDSNRYPKIIHAQCTISDYLARYILEGIKSIPADDIKESHEKAFPTVLIVGPRQFLDPVYEEVRKVYPHCILKKSEEQTLNLLQGYQRLAGDDESLLGWRIVLECETFRDAKKAIKKCLTEGKRLSDQLPATYKSRHLKVVDVVRKVLSKTPINSEEQALLEKALNCPTSDILEELKLTESPPKQSSSDDTVPTIICTTWLGAKGLSAGHVFLLGFNEGHFPRQQNNIRDNEVCNLIVGLSRTRKRCYVLSCTRFANGWLNPSIFLSWMKDQLETVLIDKNHFGNTRKIG